MDGVMGRMFPGTGKKQGRGENGSIDQSRIRLREPEPEPEPELELELTTVRL